MRQSTEERKEQHAGLTQTKKRSIPRNLIGESAHSYINVQLQIFKVWQFIDWEGRSHGLGTEITQTDINWQPVQICYTTEV